jgi:hypothetical protein
VVIQCPNRLEILNRNTLRLAAQFHLSTLAVSPSAADPSADDLFWTVTAKSGAPGEPRVEVFEFSESKERVTGPFVLQRVGPSGHGAIPTAMAVASQKHQLLVGWNTPASLTAYSLPLHKGVVRPTQTYQMKTGFVSSSLTMSNDGRQVFVTGTAPFRDDLYVVSLPSHAVRGPFGGSSGVVDDSVPSETAFALPSGSQIGYIMIGAGDDRNGRALGPRVVVVNVASGSVVKVMDLPVVINATTSVSTRAAASDLVSTNELAITDGLEIWILRLPSLTELGHAAIPIVSPVRGVHHVPFAWVGETATDEVTVASPINSVLSTFSSPATALVSSAPVCAYWDGIGVSP